jgi:hypothetical protein
MSRRVRTLLLFLPVLAAALALGPGAPRAADERRISIAGTVERVSADHFTLKDLGRDIVVEMGGQPWSSRTLAPGDRVAVLGYARSDFAASGRIRATTLMIPKVNYPGAPDDDWIAVSGTVSAIAGNLVTLDSGGRTIVADLAALPARPFAGAGGRALRIGDLVTVAGAVPDAFLAQRHGLRAASLALLPADLH